MPRPRSGGPLPSGAEVDERWKQFCNRLDELDGNVRELREMTADLLQLGHGISLALRDLAAAGVPGGTLVRVVNRLVSEFVSASARRRKGS